MPRALVISFVQWSGAWQRPQHLAVGMVRSGWDVTYLSPDYLHLRGEQTKSGVRLPPGLTILNPAALPGGGRLRAIAALNERLLTRAAVSSAGRRNPAPWDLVIFNDPRLARAAAGVPARLRVFDAMDDLSAHAPDPSWGLRRESEAVRTADRIWTGTSMMEGRLRDRHPNVRFIPCGCDYEHFAKPSDESAALARRDLAALCGGTPDPAARPLALYFGHLNDRIDPGLVGSLLDAGWRVVLVGPRGTSTPRLPEHPDLILTGPRPYRDLPGWLALADLAIVPYRTDGPHAFLYPVKILEYLAGGKPVLSTPLPDVVRFLGDFVILAEDAGQWGEIAADRPDRNPETMRRVRLGGEYASRRSWENMVTEMLEDAGHARDTAPAASCGTPAGDGA